jgi:hypothetical protein
LPDGKKDIFRGTTLIIPCLNDNAQLQFNAINSDVFQEEVQKAKLALSNAELNNLWNALQATMWSKEEMIQNLSPKVPCIEELFRLWETTPLNHLELTPVGIAIGHGNLVRLVKFEADLSIWIK